jgi:hypothetical protein
MFGKFQTYQDVLREVVRRAILLIVDCNREALSRRRGRGVSIGSVQVRLVDHWRTQDWSFGLWLSNLQLRLLRWQGEIWHNLTKSLVETNKSGIVRGYSQWPCVYRKQSLRILCIDHTHTKILQ